MTEAQHDKTILLVDDSDLVAGVLTQFFSARGYRVVRAENGAEGIRLAYAEIPDVIIMDVEMPLIQGYQASRLLKHRRGVREIPIIMHTSRSEDRDQYWAFDSGADAFINKDFDNLETLAAKVDVLADHPPPDLSAIREDEGGVAGEALFETMGGLFDEQLFKSAVVNLLTAAGKRIGSLSATAEGIFEVLDKVCEVHLAAILMKYGREPVAYIRPSDAVFRADVDELYRVCLNDFYRHFPDLNLEKTRQVFLNLDHRGDFNKLRIDGRRISSYTAVDIRGKGDTVVGTLHLGNLTNNYFSDTIVAQIRTFTDYAGIILENAILFNQISEMQHKIRTVFAKLVPKEIIDDLVERHSEAAFMTGEKRELAVLFSDIRSFTTISEHNSAEDVVSFLNQYFNTMVGIIKAHGGTIDKFVGDAILAIFGAPKSYEDNARRAVRAAIEMIRAASRVDLGNLVLPPDGFQIGIGIHEGPAVVGFIGSFDKLDYTVIGDTVNLASRLEGLTKYYKRPIIVSETVRERIADEIFLREVDTVKVKGKETATAIYTAELDPEPFSETFTDHYHKGLKLYKMGSWDTALEYFNACAAAVPDDPVTALFIERCKAFRDRPPSDWDGTVVMDFK